MLPTALPVKDYGMGVSTASWCGGMRVVYALRRRTGRTEGKGLERQPGLSETKAKRETAADDRPLVTLLILAQSKKGPTLSKPMLWASMSM